MAAAFITYLLYEASYTMFNIPYGSLLSAMADNDAQRAKLSSARGFGSIIGTLIPMVLFPVIIDYDQSNALIADKRICGITLTGSTPVGREIAAESGKNLKKCVMELGGSDAMVVLPDADLQKAVTGAIMGRMTISGQVCAGDKRMFIHESLFDAFKAGVTQTINGMVAGDPLDPKTTLSPVCSKKAADKVRSQIAKAVANGATATEVGPKVPENSAFVQPTILTGVTPENPIFDEEIFVPVLMLFSCKTEEGAIALANGTDFGLGSSVYSEDPAHAARVAAAMESGAVSINQPTMASPAIPFGGVKTSGFGREMGAEGIREFTNQKYINSAQIDMDKVFEQY